MKSFTLLSIITLGLAAVGCGLEAGIPTPDRDPATPPPQSISPQTIAVVAPSTHSACLQPEQVQPAGVQVSVDGGTIRIVDHEAEFNCCLEPIMEVRVEGNHVIAVEREEGGPGCNCICTYEISAEVHHLPAGSYQVSVLRDGEENPIGEQTVSVVGGGEPIVLGTSQSQCLDLTDSDPPGGGQDDGPAGSSTVEVQVAGHLVTVTDRVEMNCCAVALMEARVEGSTIQVLSYEDPEVDPCDCICPFEVSMELQIADGGLYTVEVYRYAVSASTRVHTEEISIPGE